MAYLKAFRERVAAAHAESGSSAEVAETFGCSEAWIRRLTQRLRNTGSLAPRSTVRADDQRAYDEADEAAIRALIKERPDATQAEVAAAIVAAWAARAARAAWFDRLAGRRVADLLFLDGFGTNTKMQRTHRRATRGGRVVAAVPHGHYVTVSMVAVLSARGVIASASFGGGTTAARFAGSARRRLVRVLRGGQVLVPDNLSANNGRRVDELVAAAGCGVMRLPPYSPPQPDRERDREDQGGAAEARTANRAGAARRHPRRAPHGHRGRREGGHDPLRLRYEEAPNALVCRQRVYRRGTSTACPSSESHWLFPERQNDTAAGGSDRVARAGAVD